jgi:hypothetical protein
MKNSKKPNNKLILDNSLIENEDQKNEWLVNQKDINLNSSENSENSEYIKVITASLELNQIEFPRLFELNEDAMSDILKKMLTIGYNTYFPKNELNNDAKLIYENQPQLSTKFDILDTLINKLTGISNNSKKIGIFGENYIQELIAKNFIGVSYQKTGEIDHSGDGLLTLSNGSEILIEIKNYSNIVNDDEVDKFTFDMKTTKRKYGLFLSLNSKINKSKILDLKTFTHDNEVYYQFFVSNLSDDLHRLEVGILLLQVLSEHKNTKSKEYVLDDTIKEKLTILIDHINENEKLRGCFLDTEKDIRNSLNNFYQKLRDNHMDIENKIKSIFTTLKDNNITNLPSESEENQLLIKYKNTKIINILKKTIDYLDTNSIEYTFNDKEITIKEYGLIKILKEKIVLHTKSKLVIPINIDNWQLFENQFNL